MFKEMSGESIELISNDTVDICYSDILILANSIKNFTTRIYKTFCKLYSFVRCFYQLQISSATVCINEELVTKGMAIRRTT